MLPHLLIGLPDVIIYRLTSSFPILLLKHGKKLGTWEEREKSDRAKEALRNTLMVVIASGLSGSYSALVDLMVRGRRSSCMALGNHALRYLFHGWGVK